MTTHAKLSASGSARWINCPGSVAAEENFPNTTSIFAEEGTAAHELAEIVLSEGGSTFNWEGRFLPENNTNPVTQEMCNYIQDYVDYVRLIKGELLVEQRVDFSSWVHEGFGTCDAIVIDGSHLHIVDLKYGKGVPVYAEDNTQAILYALGAYSDYDMIHDIQQVTVSIVQPRLNNISEWSLSLADLLLWGERISQAAQATQEDAAPRVPSEKACQWCKAKATCPALHAKAEKLMLSNFDDFDAANPDSLTHEQLVQVLKGKKLLMAWLEAVEDYATFQLKAGKDFAGYKLVAGRSLRAWGDDEAAEKILIKVLGEAAFSKKLISVAQAEKTLGKGKTQTIDGLIVKPEGAPTLAPNSDPRPSVNISPASFD